MNHDLKTWKPYFQHELSGWKKFEYRKNDRDFKLGDVLTLLEYDQTAEKPTGRKIVAHVEYIVYGPDFGIPEGYCIMGIKVLA